MIIKFWFFFFGNKKSAGMNQSEAVRQDILVSPGTWTWPFCQCSRATTWPDNNFTAKSCDG